MILFDEFFMEFFMNLFKQWIDILKIYFININIILTSFFFILLIQIIKYSEKTIFSGNNNIILIINEYLTSFIIYFSMILIMLIYYKGIKKFNLLNKFFDLILRCWWIFLLKFLWNFSFIIIIGVDYIPNENSSILPGVILLLTWLIILIVSSYIIPKTLIDPKNNLSFNSFIEYFFKSFWKFIFFILFAILTTFLIIIFYAKIFDWIFHSLKFLIDPTYLKLFFETILDESISKIVYSHLLSITAIYNYMKINSKYKHN